MKQKKKILARIEISVIVALLLVLAVVSQIGRQEKTAKITENKKEAIVPSVASAESIVGETPADDAGHTAAGSESQSEQPGTSTQSETVQLTISAAGDCTLGKDKAAAYATSLNAFYDARGASYFLEDVKSVFEGDDLTITNMEGTLTESDAIVEKSFNFKADAAYADILTEGSVEAVNLANNHSRDYGEKGYTDTIEALDAAGIVNFGYERTATMKMKDLQVTLLGYNLLSKRESTIEQMKESVAKAKVEGGNLVIVSFHWGKERQYAPLEYQKTAAHAAIDAGADLVLGHHPHVLQGVEKYNGRYICYSLGNFCFGGNKNPSDKDTMIFQQTFTFEGGNLLDDDQVRILPCSLSSSTKKNDYRPRILKGKEKERVKQKIEEMSDIPDNISWE